jgi:transcriptional regulator with XRE-family HTH domain
VRPCDPFSGGGRTPNRIREHREAAGLSQRKLGRLAGVGRATIQRAEHGTHLPTAGTLAALALALGLPVEELLAPPDATDLLAHRETAA